MKFGNVALYCKGWYKHRKDGVKTMWMDMIHCINNDGWWIWNKHDVAQWCLCRLDELRNDKNFPYQHKLQFQYCYNEIHQYIERDQIYHHENIDIEDAIILYFYNMIGFLESKYFDEERVKPNEEVLPLRYDEAYYDDGKYSSNHKPVYTFAEMKCDVEARIDKFFPNAKEQNINEYNSFEYIEGLIRGKKWQDVLVINGTDSLLDCEEVLLDGAFLNKSGSIIYKDRSFLNINIYEHCKFDNDKKYVCRVKCPDPDDIFEDYKLMSVLKEI